eukprot:CAMPEP_0174701146 /NCGR_PEP_ID=MMETSP1094-20130205/5881_1 /TAXON_ID=156173 /ORGANISM="Chrysochromulina brevifilum, Strain UTEX LB 985" /LENGTH=49 /DNA_ID= /DNA_START= /DNA_END= /DNA_ORIENTATION=
MKSIASSLRLQQQPGVRRMDAFLLSNLALGLSQACICAWFFDLPLVTLL